MFINDPSPDIHYIFVPVTRIEFWRIEGECRVKKKFLSVTMNMMQQETGDQKESGYGHLDFGTPTDDEEVYTIPSHDIIKEVPDFPDIDIRNEQTLSNT